MNKFFTLPLCFILLAGLTGCSLSEALSAGASVNEADASVTEGDSEDTASGTGASVYVSASVDVSDMFSDRDKNTAYDETTAARITLDPTGASCDSDAVSIDGQTVTITDEGTYILSGTLEAGMVIVDAQDSDKVWLVFDNVSISNDTSAAVYMREADKVVITLADGSENTLYTQGNYETIDDNNIDAAIFSKDDLTINGTGTLKVTADIGHGIVSKDDLVIAGGNLSITAASHGLSANDSIRITDASLTIISGKDGIQAENSDDESLGFVYIQDGTLQISASGDGISAGSYAQLDGGEYAIVSGGGSTQAPEHTQDWSDPFGAGTSQSDTEDTTSTKGIKTGQNLLINGGTYQIDSCDDALHSNGDMTINGGTFNIATGDDGAHADNALIITDGEITITDSYESLEGLSIEISGGAISLVADDDGLNAAGGNDQSGFMAGPGRPDDFSSEDTQDMYILISGGQLYVNASGDGMDSNGSITISGGEVYVSGPTDSGNGALDYASSAKVTGGIVVAVGSAGMAESFGEDSTQGVIMVTMDNQEQGSLIQLTDEDGNVLVSWTPEKSFGNVVISCPDMVQGGTYTLTAGTSETTVTLDSLIYSAGSSGMGGGMNDGMGGGMGGMNGAPGGDPGIAPGSGMDGDMNGDMSGGAGRRSR